MKKKTKIVLGTVAGVAALGLGYYYLYPAKTQLTAGSFAVTQGTNYSFRTQSSLSQTDLQTALAAMGFTGIQMLPSPSDTPQGQGNIDVAATYNGQTGNLAAQQSGFAFINMIAV